MLKDYSFRAKIKIYTLQVFVRKVQVGCPNLGQSENIHLDDLALAELELEGFAGLAGVELLVVGL